MGRMHPPLLPLHCLPGPRPVPTTPHRGAPDPAPLYSYRAMATLLRLPRYG